jgi:hypothetical protein
MSPSLERCLIVLTFVQYDFLTCLGFLDSFEESIVR